MQDGRLNAITLLQLGKGPIIGALLGGVTYKMFQHSVVPFACCPRSIECPTSSSSGDARSTNQDTTASNSSISSVGKPIYEKNRGSTDSGISETQRRATGSDQTIFLPIG